MLLVVLFVGAGSGVPGATLELFPAAEPETVRGVLQLLASGALTVASVTFSILMVVLTMTASTFSPRALANFMRDRVNQNTLGVFLGAFAFGAAGLLLLVRKASIAIKLEPRSHGKDVDVLQRRTEHGSAR